MSKPRVLVMDIETSPMLGYVWGLWDNNVALNQIKEDWYVMSWAAKWVGDDRVIQMDQRRVKNMEDDRLILKNLWKLLNAADIVVTQNGVKFDHRKLNARFVFHGMKPPKIAKKIDILKIAKKMFAFSSNKLEYMSKHLSPKHAKSEHKDFPGFELWRECLARNPKAWKEMAKYNCQDVRATEALYHKFLPWDTCGVNFAVFEDSNRMVCSCGSHKFIKDGYARLKTGVYRRWRCKKCGAPVRSTLGNRGSRTVPEVG